MIYECCYAVTDEFLLTTIKLDKFNVPNECPKEFQIQLVEDLLIKILGYKTLQIIREVTNKKDIGIVILYDEWYSMYQKMKSDSDFISKYGIMSDVCPLCGRQMPESEKSKHHMIPKSKGGKHKDIQVIHRICHNKIHSLFSESELAKKYNTVDSLLEDRAMSDFVKWVSTKPDNFYQTNKKSNTK